MAVNVDGLTKTVIGEATKMGGSAWSKIQKSAPFYIKGYLQTLAEIAVQRQRGYITSNEARIFTKEAYLLLVQGLANTAQIILYEVQSFLNKLIGALKETINKALPLPLL